MHPASTQIGGALWSALRSAEAPLTARQISGVADIPRGTANQRLLRWTQAGLLTRTDERPARYMRSPDAPERTPRLGRDQAVRAPDTGRQRIWMVMRIKKRFDLIDLMSCADVGERTARTFLGYLVGAGYVAKIQHANIHIGLRAIYRLARSTGPKAPSIRQSRATGRLVCFLHDPNTGATIPLDRKDARSSASEDGGVG